MSSIEGKVEFGGKVRGAWKMQTGTVIAQIADDTIDRRAAGQNEPGALKYFRPRNAPTLNHGQPSNIQFGENDFGQKLFHNRKRVCSYYLNLWKLSKARNALKIRYSSQANMTTEKHSVLLEALEKLVAEAAN
jgi:hypothetical protein